MLEGSYFYCGWNKVYSILVVLGNGHKRRALCSYACGELFLLWMEERVFNKVVLGNDHKLRALCSYACGEAIYIVDGAKRIQ